LLGINTPTYGTITVSPNPFSEQTTITIPNTMEYAPLAITITDVTGKVLRTITNPARHSELVSESAQNPNNKYQIVIERGNLKPGVYFVELRGDKIYRGKWIVK